MAPPNSNDPSDSGLCDLGESYPTGSEAKYAWIVDRFQKGLLAFYLAQYKNRADAEDATQELFLSILSQIDRIDPARLPKVRNVRAYLFKWAASKFVSDLRARNSLRRGGGLTHEPIDERIPDPRALQAVSHVPSAPDADEDVIGTLLSEAELSILTEIYRRGRKRKDIAKELGVHPRTVSRREQRALGKLREYGYEP